MHLANKLQETCSVYIGKKLNYL